MTDQTADPRPRPALGYPVDPNDEADLEIAAEVERIRAERADPRPQPSMYEGTGRCTDCGAAVGMRHDADCPNARPQPDAAPGAAKYRILKPDQYREGYLELNGIIATPRPYTLVCWLDDGNAVVEEPRRD